MCEAFLLAVSAHMLQHPAPGLANGVHVEKAFSPTTSFLDAKVLLLEFKFHSLDHLINQKGNTCFSRNASLRSSGQGRPTHVSL